MTSRTPSTLSSVQGSGLALTLSLAQGRLAHPGRERAQEVPGHQGLKSRKVARALPINGSSLSSVSR